MVSLGFIRRAFLLFLAAAGCVDLAQGSATEQSATARITAQEEADTLAALKAPKRQRPVVAVLGQNDGSETTDFLVPFGVLRSSGLADVFAVSIRPGPVTLMPSLTIVPDMTTGTPCRTHAAMIPCLIIPDVTAASILPIVRIRLMVRKWCSWPCGTARPAVSP